MTSSYMEQALELARNGVGQTSPNPAVGAVIVKDGEIVGRGFHTWSGVKHAEVLALEQAGERARGAELYITLEPCSHSGRTGPCADALIQAGIARVVAAMEDPNPQVRGQGLARLRSAGVQVEVAAEFEPPARKLNEAFVHFMTTGRPLVMLKAAVTLDGKIAAPEDNQGWITSETARAHVQTLRHTYDAILTGIGTVLADDCLLTDRTGEERSRPLLRIVLDSQLRLPPTSKMVASCREDVLVVTTSVAQESRRKALEGRGVRVIVCDGKDGRTNPAGAVDYLARNSYLSLMIEAGSKVNWGVLEAGIVDKIFFYYAPKILGGMQSLPVAGGAGRRRRKDAIRFTGVQLHAITANEFAVEAWARKD
jgi:diaminohydroxyphosphoribosylaminopyrimidine deaminase / 5-amino-6-(5-phosphoribosylamino)uracil reductase